MSRDIVDRLRTFGIRDCNGVWCPPPIAPLAEAADEIERLRAQNKIFAKVIVLGDEYFTDEEWEEALKAAERIVPILSA